MPSKEGERTRFVVDAMLGSLSRKLRALGFDAAYYKSGDDRGLLGFAKEGSRVILTSDRALAARANAIGLKAVLLSAPGDGPRLKELSREARRSGFSLVRGDSLCSTCGGTLESVSKLDARQFVPPAVLHRHRLFFRCVSCGKYYWRGGHWKRLMSLARNLRD